MALPTNMQKRNLQHALATNLEEFECLWNPSCDLYSNKIARDHAWKELARMCGVDVSQLRTAYDTLRRRFRDVGTFIHGWQRVDHIANECIAVWCRWIEEHIISVKQLRIGYS